MDLSYISCSWDEFEDWIRRQIGGSFSWKIRPIDSKDNRKAVAESILMTIKQNNGTFPPKGNMFIEKLIKKNKISDSYPTKHRRNIVIRFIF